MRSLGTVLGVWAHPDDETYLCGGIMAAAVAAGSRVVCVTATRGELGSTDPVRWPPGEALARVRTEELENALRHLGVTEHHWLDYPDGARADVDSLQSDVRSGDALPPAKSVSTSTASLIDSSMSPSTGEAHAHGPPGSVESTLIPTPRERQRYVRTTPITLPTSPNGRQVG